MKNLPTFPLAFALILCLRPTFGQDANTIHLQNPSFEGTPAEGSLAGPMPQGWFDCGFPGESVPDVFPLAGGGTFKVGKTPSHGETYLGMVVRENNTWEAVSNRLSSPLVAGEQYEFVIDLCRSELYVSRSRVDNAERNFTTPAKLRIWGGNEHCQKSELLAESALIVNTRWLKYQFKFAPKQTHTHLTFEAHYKLATPFPYNGNLLLDNASEIKWVGSSIQKLSETDRREFTRSVMGTEVKIVIYHPDSVAAKAGANAAFDRMRAIELMFGEAVEDGELNRLAKGENVKVSKELWDILTLAKAVAERSEGAFDPSSGASYELWQQALAQRKFPSKSSIESALQFSGYTDIKVDEYSQKVRLKREGMRLNISGLAKAYAVDEAMRRLHKNHLLCAMIAAGDYYQFGDKPPGKKGWNLETDARVSPTMGFANTALALYTMSETSLEHNEKQYFGLLDPRTGMGVTKRRSVVANGSNCLDAQAWALAAAAGISKLLTVDLRQEGVRLQVSEQ